MALVFVAAFAVGLVVRELADSRDAGAVAFLVVLLGANIPLWLWRRAR